MKLSTEIKENLKQLDYEYGGGIKTRGTQVDVIDKPVLIVGLGGTGAESLIRVKKSINQYFKPGTTAGGHMMDKPSNIEYLAIDSDDNLNNLRYKGISFSKENDEFVLLENANLMSIYRNRDSVFKDLTNSWVSGNLRLQQIKHGAGGIRQAGRFLMFININSVIAAITEKINRLTLNRTSKDLLYVFILTGTSGGTGSGTFIDIPYLIRRIAEAKGFETENIGMIFLPDVTLSDNSIDGAAALNIKANGFASLKELDYLMNLERNDEFFEQTYSDIDIKTNEPPYDLCHLISSKDETGKTMTNAKNYCMNVAAETVINFIASEEVVDGQNYTISSYLSNIENNRYTFLMTHSQKQPTNYIYNIVGASCAVLPVNFLANHLTYRVFGHLESMFNNAPSAGDIDLTMQALGLDMSSVEAELKMGRPRARDLGKYDYGILSERPDIADDALKKDMINYREHLDQRAQQVLENLKNMLTDSNNIIMQHFCDFELGPFYARHETSASGENSVLRHIENIRKRAIVQRRDPKDVIESLELKKQLTQDKMNFRHFWFFRGRVVDDLLNAAEDYYNAVMKNDLCDTLDRIYESAHKMLYEYGYKVVDTQCEMLLAIKTLFDKYKDPAAKSRDADIEDSFTWDMVSAEEFCQYVGKSRELELTFDSRAVLKHFLIELAARPHKWVLDTRANIARELSEFISHQLEGVMDKS
ncbi:MAG: tubulin-like doman-containing protein, partial [Defluviitaleaceae bacterium]|nr:tubulin-like doman-containing protein [Defluviitaleaceae bacterium]